MITLFLLGSQIVNAQYGQVRTDSYKNVTKGAFWKTRPEAKAIYYGGTVAGFTEVTLEYDCYVRFIEEEHNSMDRNIIVFPKGEKIYMDSRGQYYAAICGNKIDYWEYVNQNSNVPIKTVATQQDKWTPPQNLGQAVMSMPAQNVSAPQFVVVKTKTWFGKNCPWIIAAAAATITTTVLVIKNQHHSNVVIETRTMPDSLPSKGTSDGPGLDSDPRGMPGGG